MKLLFIANNPTILSGMTYLITHMCADYPNVLPTLVCENCCFETKDFEVINLTPDYVPAHQQSNGQKTNEWFNVGQRNFKTQTKRFIQTYRRLGKQDRVSKKILNEIQPDALIIADDRMTGYIQGFIKNVKVPIIRVPIATTIISGLYGREWNDETIVDGSFPNDLYKFFNREWVKEWDGQKRLFLSVGYSIAAYMRKMISDKPWYIGAGRTDYVFVANEDEQEHLIAGGVNKDIVLTGLVEDYEIVKKREQREYIRQQLKEKYTYNNECMVVFSVPQLAEHYLTTWDIHRKNMTYVVKSLCERYGQIFLSLHPKSRKEDYVFLAERFNVVFLEERLYETISSMDIVVCVGTSSVRHLAVLAGSQPIYIPMDLLLDDLEQILVECNEQVFVEEDTNNVNVNNVKCVWREIVQRIE